ncbi:MAG: hypothetical protein V4610_09330 [Pseudomonadota bacterium]|jgi:hypothetical protein
MRNTTATALALLSALVTASPALAQSSGSANIGGAIGVGLGGFSDGSVNTASVSGTSANSLNGSINNELSGSSGSGFAGTMDINSLPGGTSYAVVGGLGQAGTVINTSVGPNAVGDISSYSFNSGIYGGLTGGNAALSFQVLNFGQSSADYKFNVNFAQNNTLNFDANSADWNVAGAAGEALFGFGTLGWSAQ